MIRAYSVLERLRRNPPLAITGAPMRQPAVLRCVDHRDHLQLRFRYTSPQRHWLAGLALLLDEVADALRGKRTQ